MTVGLLIAIRTPKEIDKNIIDLRKYIVKKVGKNILGSHEPHITLLVNSFPNFSDVEKKIISITKKHGPFNARIEGLHTFTFDPITNAYTIVYKVEKTPALTSIQKDVFDRLSPLRNEDQSKWLLQQNPNPPKETMKNIRKYGYPFGPKEWVFHAGIGSVPEKKYEEIWKNIHKYDVSKSWRVNDISVFIHMGDDGFRFFRKYKL